MVQISDIDHYNATFVLAVLSRRRHTRLVLLAIGVDRKLDATTLLLAPSFLFLLEDLFDNPGIQHGGPPFRYRWSSLTIDIYVAPKSSTLQPTGLWTLSPAYIF